MKSIFALSLLAFGLNSFAELPQGDYIVEKVVCSDGRQLKLGGKFMEYTITLKITEDEMFQQAIAKSGSWAPFRLNCVQKNVGKYTQLSESQYEGFMEIDDVTCNASAWESMLYKKGFGVEKLGVFDYKMENGLLLISNERSENKFSCKNGSFPTYYYKKQ